MRDLRAFIAVYEERSFTRAAAREHATQPGLSQHIRKLEDRYAVRLFERSAGGALPTPAADRLYRLAVAATRAEDAAFGMLRSFGGALDGDVRVGVMPTVSAGALAPAMIEMRERHPNVRLDISEGYSGALTSAVEAGQIDFAVVPRFDAGPALTLRPFVAMPEALLSARALGLPAEADLASLPAIRLVIPKGGNTRTAVLRSYLAAHAIPIHDWIEVDSMMATFDLVGRTDWLAIVPWLVTAGATRGAQLQVSRIKPDLMLDLVSIEPVRRRLSPAAETFRSILQDHCARLLPS